MDQVYSDAIWKESGCRAFEAKTLQFLKNLIDTTNTKVGLVDLIPDDEHFYITDNFVIKPHIGLYPEYYGNYFYNPKYVDRKPKKLFCCFINRADVFRQSWLYQFVRQKLFENGAISYRLDYRDNNIPFDVKSDQLRLFEHLHIGNEIFLQEHNFLKEKMPLQTFNTSLEQAIIDSKISLVLETYFHKSHAVALSEKIFRNLLLPRPFLLFNNPGAIQHLRNCGFDVFDDLVDHSYDNISDGVTKQLHILKQIKEFKSVEYSDKFLARLNEGCNHNKIRLKMLKKMWPKKLESVIQTLEQK